MDLNVVDFLAVKHDFLSLVVQILTDQQKIYLKHAPALAFASQPPFTPQDPVNVNTFQPPSKTSKIFTRF